MKKNDNDINNNNRRSISDLDLSNLIGNPVLTESNIKNNEVQKMLFIYNAVNDGWTIRKIGFDKFELLKDNEHIKKEIVLEEYLKKYIKYSE
jgi:hypothetical protein